MARDKEMAPAVLRTFYEDEMLLFLLGLSLVLEYHYSVCALCSLTAPEKMFLLSLHRTDRIRLLAAPAEAIHLVARAVHQVRVLPMVAIHLVARDVHQVRVLTLVAIQSWPGLYIR
jgi:hypothetical protein